MSLRLSKAWPVMICLALTGCASEDASRPANSKDHAKEIRQLRQLAYQQMRELALRTCAAVPRRVLWESLADASNDPRTASGPSDNNGIALLFAEDVTMQDIPLQRAAYDGCSEGLESQP